MKKINVLQLVTGLGMGGAEKVVFDLATNINKNDFNIYVVSLSTRDERLQEFLNENIDTTVLYKDNSLFDLLYIVKGLNSFVNERNIEIIHAHMAHAVIVASILRIINPYLKIIYTSHNLNIGSKLREFIVWMLKPLRELDIVFSKDILKYFYKSNYKIIPNGINVKQYELRLEKNNKFTFIAIGRLEIVKNHKFLIEIANELKEDFDFELQIVGHGYLKKELEEIIKKYHLEEYVKLLGLRNDIAELLNKAHCLVMPSLWEGLPIVILEAGASSLPIISTSVGSIPSLLNANNAYLSDLEHFKDSMIYVLNHYDEARQKGKKLFNDIKNIYAIEKIVNAHEKIYKGI